VLYKREKRKWKKKSCVVVPERVEKWAEKPHLIRTAFEERGGGGGGNGVGEGKGVGVQG